MPILHFDRVPSELLRLPHIAEKEKALLLILESEHLSENLTVDVDLLKALCMHVGWKQDGTSEETISVKSYFR
jgi:hypothetical protein